MHTRRAPNPAMRKNGKQTQAKWERNLTFITLGMNFSKQRDAVCLSNCQKKFKSFDTHRPILRYPTVMKQKLHYTEVLYLCHIKLEKVETQICPWAQDTLISLMTALVKPQWPIWHPMVNSIHHLLRTKVPLRSTLGQSSSEFCSHAHQGPQKCFVSLYLRHSSNCTQRHQERTSSPPTCCFRCQ